jgi:hypothetical protein
MMSRVFTKKGAEPGTGFSPFEIRFAEVFPPFHFCGFRRILPDAY